MSATYTVKAAKNAGEKSNPHGGTLVKWYLTVADEQGTETADVYCQKKPGNPLNPGDAIYGRLEQGEYGWRLYPEQNPNGATRRSGGSSRGSDDQPPEFWAARDKRISRAGVLQAVVASGQYADLKNDVPNFVTAVNAVTDALLASLDERTPSPNDADVGGGNPSPAGSAAVDTSAKGQAARENRSENWSEGVSTYARTMPGGDLAPPPETSPKGFVSQPQQQLFERLLREAGAKPETVNAVVLYASEALSGRQGGAISEAIDGLKSDDQSVRRSTGKTLALAAEEWRKKQPVAGEPDATDLPPADGMAVGAADDSVPF